MFSDDFGGMNKIKVNSTLVWKPDIARVAKWGKLYKKSHLVELKKLENNIQAQIGPCKSVGVRNRPQRDQFSQFFVGDF